MEEHIWYIVLNPKDDTHNLLAFKELLDTYNDVKAYCISFEVSDNDNQHYHLYLQTNLSQDAWRGRFKHKFRCTSRFSSKEVQDKIRAIAYTIKDGTYYQKNIDVNTFLMAQQVSHKKRPRYENALRDIDENYIAGNIDLKSYYRKVLELNVEYRRKTYLQHIRAHVMTVRMEASNDYLIRAVNKLLDDD